jgi:hypothetical protein
VNFRGALVRVGRSLAVAWAFVVDTYRRHAPRRSARQGAIDALRRRYVFGAVGRQAFEDGVRKLGGYPKRRFRRKSKRSA